MEKDPGELCLKQQVATSKSFKRGALKIHRSYYAQGIMACPWEWVSSAKSVQCLESRPIPHMDLQTIFFPWKLDLGYCRSTQFRSLLDEQISFQSLGLIPSVMAQWFSPCSGFKPSGIHRWKPCQHSATELDLGCQWLVGWVGPCLAWPVVVL